MVVFISHVNKFRTEMYKFTLNLSRVDFIYIWCKIARDIKYGGKRRAVKFQSRIIRILDFS